MAQSLLIAGAGGFGREVAELVRAINATSPGTFELVGFLDDGDVDSLAVERTGTALLGSMASAADLGGDAQVVIAIGSPRARHEVDQILTKQGRTAATLVHPRASVGSDVRLGAGTIVCANSTLTTNISTGRHVHIDMNSTVGHDAVLGDRVRLNPGATVSGNVVIDEDVLVGANACILQGLHIGAGAVIAAGAVVVRPVAAGAVVKGVPAR